MTPEAQRTNAKRFFLYQIAYSDETWESVPKDVLPLDDRANEKPDSAEIWPIRRFLQNEVLDDNAFYGFISPRFEEKMLCTTAEVIDFVTNVADDVDVAAFSPFIDLRALFLNIFEQGEFYIPATWTCVARYLKMRCPASIFEPSSTRRTKPHFLQFLRGQTAILARMAGAVRAGFCDGRITGPSLFGRVESPVRPSRRGAGEGICHRAYCLPASGGMGQFSHGSF